MNVDVITDSRGFARLEGAWRQLEAAPGLLGLFHGYTWQREWWQALGHGRSLRLLLAREGANVCGILPLYVEPRDGCRRLAFVGSPGGGSDYLDALCRDASTRERLVFEATRLDGDVLELEDVSSSSALVPELLSQASESQLSVECVQRYPCPYIPIRTGFDEFQKTLSRRDNLRRRRKWFAGQPGFRIVCETSPNDVAPFLERYFRLHAARWRVDGGSQAFLDPRLIAFQRSVVARLAAEGRAKLWTLFVAGDAVAVAYAFEDRGRSLYYQSGFLPAWGARSAGLVLFAQYVEDAFNRGLQEVDLLRGNETYKSEWTGEARHTVAIRIALTVRGRAALAWREARTSLRDRARAALPEAVRLATSTVVRERRMRGAG
jgi:CelD/BcsL family acetyltransferase involved in cellulose biosynthesis